MKKRFISQLLAITVVSAMMTTGVMAADLAPWDKNNTSADRWEYNLDEIRDAMKDPVTAKAMEDYLKQKGYTFTIINGQFEIVPIKPAVNSGLVVDIPVPDSGAVQEPAQEESVAEEPAASESSVEETSEEEDSQAEDAADESAAGQDSSSSTSEIGSGDSAGSTETAGSSDSTPQGGDISQNQPSQENGSEDAGAGTESGLPGLSFENDLLDHHESEKTDAAQNTDLTEIMDITGSAQENVVELVTVPGITGTSAEHSLLVANPSTPLLEEAAGPESTAEDDNGTTPNSESLNQVGPGSNEIIGQVDRPATGSGSGSSSSGSNSGANSGSQSGGSVVPAQNVGNPKTGDAGHGMLYGALSAASAAFAGVLLKKRRSLDKKENKE
ncbi:MAG: hypothetical protein KBS83_08600 [Lachnospiraceae bacterium]|nr:hypothetical protein [Candidatus Equihabitans merdae]